MSRDLTQLRCGSNVSVEDDFSVSTYVNSKGETYKHTVEWIKDMESKLTDEARAKFYIVMTRAKYALAVVLDSGIQCDLPTVSHQVGPYT